MRVFLLVIAAFLMPQTARAHGIGDLYALPIPLHYYLLGAGLAVALSFCVIAFFLDKQRSARPDRRVRVPYLPLLLAIGRAAALALLIFSIVAGTIGSQVPSENFTPTFFWVYFLIGTGIASACAGNIWSSINPWKTLSRWTMVRRPTRPVWGGVSVAMLICLFWLELVSPWSFSPLVLSQVLLWYTALNLVAQQFYRDWYERGEVFSVLFSFIGNVARVTISADERALILRSAAAKLSGIAASWTALAIAAALLAGTSFDNIKETVAWSVFIDTFNLYGYYRYALTAGLMLMPLPFLAAYLAAIWVLKRLTRSERTTKDLALRFVWSLVPIAFGYTLAHNFSLFIVTAPFMLALLSDPLGYGWNIFGTANVDTTTLILGARTIWFIEIGFILAAHILGVLYAHYLALSIFKNPKTALKSQYPMILLMIGFTVFTLWLISQPLVVAG